MGEPRNQFTFYRSYFDAIAALPKREQAAIILAVCEYALYEREPEKLTPVGQTCFALIRPTLDSGRRKAASGKQGGKASKQSGSGTEAKRKQSAREKEREKEGEIEIEVESDRSKSFAAAFPTFFSAYPRQSYEDEAREAWMATVDSQDTLEQILDSLERWKASDAWAAEGGKYVPCAWKWLGKGLWRDTPPSAAPLRRDVSPDELEAIRRMMEEPDILQGG